MHIVVYFQLVYKPSNLDQFNEIETVPIGKPLLRFSVWRSIFTSVRSFQICDIDSHINKYDRLQLVYLQSGSELDGIEERRDLLAFVTNNSRDFFRKLSAELSCPDGKCFELDRAFEPLPDSFKIRLRTFDLSAYRSGAESLRGCVRERELDKIDIVFYLRDLLDFLNSIFPIGKLAEKNLLSDFENSGRIPCLFARLKRDPPDFGP